MFIAAVIYFWQIILAGMLARPEPTWDPEPPESRRFRLASAAVALDQVTALATCEGHGDDCRPRWRGPRVQLAAFLVAFADRETMLARRFHAGDCRRPSKEKPRGECDWGVLDPGPPKVWGFRAASMWQLHPNDIITLDEHAQLNGLAFDNTRRAAWYAMIVVSRKRGYCAQLEPELPWPAATFSLLATGSRCKDWAPAEQRVRVYRKVLDRMVAFRDSHRAPERAKMASR